MKKVVLILMAAVLVTSCGSSSTKKVSGQDSTKVDSVLTLPTDSASVDSTTK